MACGFSMRPDNTTEKIAVPRITTGGAIVNCWEKKAGAISYPFSIFFKKGLKRSIGIGKSMVEFFSVAISESVCR